MKPFGITKTEQFLFTHFLNPQKSADQEERRTRMQTFKETGCKDLKKSLDQMPTAENPAPVIHLHAWSDNETMHRVELHASTIAFMIKKLSGELIGGSGDILGYLCDRLISLGATDEDKICTVGGDGYRLPKNLWNDNENKAAAKHLSSV